VKIGEVDGRRYILEVSGERARLEGAKVVAEADILRLKRGATLHVGEPFDPGRVADVWEVKSGNARIRGSQVRRYVRVFGRVPVELRPSPPISRVLRAEATHTGSFVAAFLLKEAIKAVETQDAARVRRAVHQFKDPHFWSTLATFSIVGRIVQEGVVRVPLTGLPGRVFRTALPLGAGVLAAQVMSGRLSFRDAAVTTGSMLAAGGAVSLLADGLLYRLLFAAGPAGWLGATAYAVGKLGVSLYLGEKLEVAILNWLNPKKENRARHQESSHIQVKGIESKVRKLAP
jgi:hypothetical protein